MRVPVDDIGALGLAADPADQSLAPNAWTDARNVAFNDGKVCRGLGSRRVLDPPSVPPYFLLYSSDAAREAAVVYMGLQKAYVYIAGTHSNITRQAVGVDVDYNGGASDRWNGGPFAGVLIANNGIDVPQRWAPLAAGTKMQDLDNWDPDWRARVVRPFKNFLIAMGITDTGTVFPHRIVFSQPADPGAVPSTWNPGDPANDVTTRDLVDADGTPLVDGVPLGDIFIAYKEGATFGCQFTGGDERWKTYPIFETSGLLAQGCAIRFNKGLQHFVASGDDVITHNGQSPESVVTKKQRRWLQANISSSRYDRSFCFNDVPGNKCWFCFPLEGADFPNLALVYDWNDGTITFKEINQTSSIIPAIIEEGVDDPWEGRADTWDSAPDTWDTFSSKLFLRQPLAAFPAETAIRQLDTLNQFDGVSFNAYVERTGLDVMGIDRYGHLVRDRAQRKLIRHIWLQASGAPFYVQIGRQTLNDGAISWSMPRLFTPGVDDKVDFSEEVQLYGVRFFSQDDAYWEIKRYEIDVEPLGQF